MNTEEFVRCTGLTKNYSGHKALDQVDLTLQRGKIIGLLGPNGSGKTTLIKLMNGLLQPTFGKIEINGFSPGPYTKSIVSYLPDKTYFASWMKVQDIFDIFESFYENFSRAKAVEMCRLLGILPSDYIREMSKGTIEKVQLILVMSRDADLYLLDEPIAGVDPAARDYILGTILSNYNERGTILISTHLISDIENILDEVVFLQSGRVILHDAVDQIRQREGKSIDDVFKEMFRLAPIREGGYRYV